MISSPTPGPQSPTPTVRIGNAAFTAELAVTQPERTKGLSGRDSLPVGTGMLFVFERDAARSFWMRGMRFPLDFIWVSKDCLVADVTRDVPVPEAGSETSGLPTYSPREPAAYNFEVNAGEAARYGIEVGDAVRFAGMPAALAGVCE